MDKTLPSFHGAPEKLLPKNDASQKHIFDVFVGSLLERPKPIEAGLGWVCLFAIAWLLFRKRKSRHPEPASTNTPAIVAIILASPGMSSDADCGRTRLINGGDPSRN